ncbi:hypothetical protein EJB05_38341, partial [Eragrostis curvula]
MEAMEASAVEAAVLWLAQTILANLLLDKLDEWLRQVVLADDIQKLKVEIEKVEGVVSAGKGRAVGNRQLARLLARLKELLYDADDVVDELDYYRLKHEVEGANFNVALNHTCSASDSAPNDTTDLTRNSTSRKRTRVDEELTHNTAANPHPWDKAKFSNKIQQIARKLQDIRLQLNEIHSVSSANLNHYQNSTSYQCLRTSSLAPRKALVELAKQI